MIEEMEIHAAGTPPDETSVSVQATTVPAAEEAPQTEPEVKRKRGRPRKTAAPADESGSEAKEVMTPQAMAMTADEQDILTIESTRTVETEADKAKNDLLDLMESLRGKRILQGVIQGVESSRNGEPRAVVFKGEFKVMIPASLCVDRPKDFRGMKPNDVLKYLITKRLGAEVEYIVKGIDPESGVVVASRHEAMAIRRRQFYYGKDRKGNNLIYEGRIAEARVISVIRTGAFVELFGVEYFIRLEELGYQRMYDAMKHFSAGQRILVKVLRLDTQDGNLPGAVLEKLEEISIEELDLSIKTRFRLHNCNVNTLADIVLASDRDLLAIKGLGRSVLQELRKKQRQAVGELRADMAADTIAGMWEQEPTEDDETS